MRTKFIDLGVMDFKALPSGERAFSCYGNVKGNVDHARDRVVEGAYRDSITRHKTAGTMPKMFWMHDPWSTPVGVWTSMEEDSKGLYMEGRFSNTPKGVEQYELYKDGALDSFSIGYKVNEEAYNSTLKCNDLIKIDIIEVSSVTFACNEESRLVGIKNRLGEGKTLTKAELRELLETIPVGLSRNQINRITNDYHPNGESIDPDEVKSLLEGSTLFK